jgi:4,5-DOPA dioxygenase extradiol
LHHFRIGQALATAVPDDVLIVASGSMTHNLSEFRGRDINAPAPDWVADFADWVADRVLTGDVTGLLDFFMQSRSAQRNHPTDEHFLPFFVALGAALGKGQPWSGEPLHRSYTYGVLAMDTYRFDRREV